MASQRGAIWASSQRVVLYDGMLPKPLSSAWFRAALV
jgi:hypothetical protein